MFCVLFCETIVNCLGGYGTLCDPWLYQNHITVNFTIITPYVTDISTIATATVKAMKRLNVKQSQAHILTHPLQWVFSSVDFFFNLKILPLVFYFLSLHLDATFFTQVTFNGFKVNEQRWKQHPGQEDLRARL